MRQEVVARRRARPEPARAEVDVRARGEREAVDVAVEMLRVRPGVHAHGGEVVAEPGFHEPPGVVGQGGAAPARGVQPRFHALRRHRRARASLRLDGRGGAGRRGGASRLLRLLLHSFFQRLILHRAGLGRFALNPAAGQRRDRGGLHEGRPGSRLARRRHGLRRVHDQVGDAVRLMLVAVVGSADGELGLDLPDRTVSHGPLEHVVVVLAAGAGALDRDRRGVAAEAPVAHGARDRGR